MKSLRSAGRRVASRASASMLGVALEGGGVGQDREAGRAALFVIPRKRRRIEIGAAQCFDGLAFLISAIRAKSTVPMRETEARRRQRADRRGGLCPLAHGLQARRGFCGVHLFPLIGEDCSTPGPGSDFIMAELNGRFEHRPPCRCRSPGRQAPPLRGASSRCRRRAAPPQLHSTTSRNAPCCPPSTARICAAFSLASPPERSSGFASANRAFLRNPEGGDLAAVQRRHMADAGGGEPIESVGAVHHPARWAPSRPSACGIGSTPSSPDTRTNCYFVPAGLASARAD